MFVYGTLRRDVPGVARRLLMDSADYLDAGAFYGRLYDLGAYPALTPSTDPADRVCGDVFALRTPRRTLPRLDRYEGQGYRRRVGIVETQRHGRVRAWVYLYLGSLEGQSPIAEGDYVAYLERNPSARRAVRWSRMI